MYVCREYLRITYKFTTLNAKSYFRYFVARFARILNNFVDIRFLNIVHAKMALSKLANVSKIDIKGIIKKVERKKRFLYMK